MRRASSATQVAAAVAHGDDMHTGYSEKRRRALAHDSDVGVGRREERVGGKVFRPLKPPGARLIQDLRGFSRWCRTLGDCETRLKRKEARVCVIKRGVARQAGPQR